MFISDKTKSQFYDYICLFENQISQEFGKFNLDNANLQHYLQSNDIFLASLGKRNAKECKKHKQYILYDDKKPKIKRIADIPNDSAHNLLRHIRNSMAHGNLDKKTKGSKYYIIKDFTKDENVSMDGLILIESLRPMINLLIASKAN